MLLRERSSRYDSRACVPALLLLLSMACTTPAKLPQVGSAQYTNLCSAFYLGLAALQSGEDVNARKGLVEATQIAPDEPAGWLNLGLLQFRQQDFEGAYQSVNKALSLVAENSRIEALLGIIESRRGKEQEAIAHLTQAVKLDGRNLKAAYALAQETERQNSATSDAEAQKLLQQILTVEPNNLAVLVDDLRLAAKRNDAAQAQAVVRSLDRLSTNWPDAAKQQLAGLKTAKDSNVRGMAIQAQFLKNVLVRSPAYRQSLDEVRTSATSAGEPFLKFFKLPSPRSEPDEPDRQLRFERSGKSATLPSNVKWFGALALDGDGLPVPVWVDATGAHIAGGATLSLPVDGDIGAHSLAPMDLNYDFKVDVILATQSGLKFFQQIDKQQFEDISAKTKLPSEILHGSYVGAWAFDYDLDGDLDLVLGTKTGSPTVLRNNGDGTFSPVHPFAGVEGLTNFSSADVDGDGDPDVALVNGSGELVPFSNERLGDYRKRPASMSGVAALATADVNGDGHLDFVMLTSNGEVKRLSDKDAGKSWEVATLAKVPPATGGSSLTVADLDNNGALDLVVNDQVFLGDGKAFTKLSAIGQNNWYVDAVDLDGDGLLDLLSLNNGTPTIWSGRSTKKYHWQTVRPVAARTNGDQRINTFGIGGEIEVRADLLTQKQSIDSPRLHFGLGSHHSGTEFARIVWPNGLIQTEFDLKADQTLLAEQRLKGSCPYLFTWDGAKMRFLKDVAPMSGALGSHSPDGTLAPVSQTRQWFKVPGDALKSRNGKLELAVTDEYWESYFIDQYELLAIDHPTGTNVFVDERVAVPAAPLKTYLTGPLHPFDSPSSVESFGRGAYPGITTDHQLQLTLPQSAPRDKRLYLIAEGSLHPWDDSTLVAVNQGGQAKPKDLAIEVQNADGSWKLARTGLGVPAGRLKTIVLDLGDLFPPTGRRTLRLKTNLEIYWNRLSWAEALPEAVVNRFEVPLQSAQLRHRGFSSVEQNSRTGIEIPDYQQVNATSGRWPALEGFYTRFGDVKPLLTQSDGRYVIATSGDELAMSFVAPTPPASGMTRDFIFIGDGWMKEGDYSFHGSQALLPLPYPGLVTYSGHSNGLEQERAYRAHPDDWKIFHTRYATGEELRSALWNLK